MIVFGLNAFHGDSTAALVRDGKLVAAAKDERFRRVKHATEQISRQRRRTSTSFSEFLQSELPRNHATDL